MTTPVHLGSKQSEIDLPSDLSKAVEKAAQRLFAINKSLNDTIFGQQEAISNSITAIMAGGHALLIGLPGLAKTRLVSSLSKALGMDNKRIQCTPDLMPSDVIGAEVLEEVDYGKRNFRFIQGPVFCQMLMVDEINRASPRTQSALLQAMQERNVTVAGREHSLPTPFHVMATQNPLEHEGIYPLPEAQLDRFLLQIDLSYPDVKSEKRILENTLLPSEPNVKAILCAADIRELQLLVRRMPLSENIMDAILFLVRNGRPESSKIDMVKKYVKWGPGPRACQALSLTSRARALLDGRSSTSMQDMMSLVKPALKHRMSLNFEASSDGVSINDVINEMMNSIEVN